MPSWFSVTTNCPFEFNDFPILHLRWVEVVDQRLNIGITVLGQVDVSQIDGGYGIAGIDFHGPLEMAHGLVVMLALEAEDPDVVVEFKIPGLNEGCLTQDTDGLVEAVDGVQEQAVIVQVFELSRFRGNGLLVVGLAFPMVAEGVVGVGQEKEETGVFRLPAAFSR